MYWIENQRLYYQEKMRQWGMGISRKSVQRFTLQINSTIGYNYDYIFFLMKTLILFPESMSPMNQLTLNKRILHWWCSVIIKLLLLFLLWFLLFILIDVIWIVGNVIMNPFIMVNITEGYVYPGCESKQKKSKLVVCSKLPNLFVVLMWKTFSCNNLND